MAKRDTSLDGKLVEAAREEFLRLGFEKASLHDIARKAGTTTGAIYTRYDGKDALFASLLQGIFQDVMGYQSKAKNLYMEAEERRDLDLIVSAIKRESSIYRELLFKHYDECKLLICCSHGSKVGAMLSRTLEQKARETAEYFQTVAGKPIDTDSIMMIIMSQFDQFRCILDRGWSRDKACAVLEVSEVYQAAGWRALFQSIL